MPSMFFAISTASALISYEEVLAKQLKALDLSATTFCMDNGICCYAFALSDPENIYRVVMGDHIGTELHL